MINEKTFNALKKQWKTEKEIEEEFERRKRYHSNKLSLGAEEGAQQVAGLLSLMDMENGDTQHIDHTATPTKTTNELNQTIEILAGKDPQGLLHMMDALYRPPKKKR